MKLRRKKETNEEPVGGSRSDLAANRTREKRQPKSIGSLGCLAVSRVYAVGVVNQVHMSSHLLAYFEVYRESSREKTRATTTTTDTAPAHVPMLLKDGDLDVASLPRAVVPDLAIWPRQAEPRPVLEQPARPARENRSWV